MFRNVLVGVDHLGGGRDAVALAQQLVSSESTVIVAHVYTGDPYVYRGVGAEYTWYERKRDLDRMVQALAEAGVQAERRWHRASSVGRGLQELCATLDADLLVLGAPRRHGFEHLLEHAADGAQRASLPLGVAVAPVGHECEPSTIDEIGVGYSGSEASRTALRVAEELANRHGSRLSVFEAHSSWGRPPEELALFSRIVDLLVIGSPRRITPRRPRPGGVARELARHARCPLLVVRPAAVSSSDVADG